MCAGGRRADCGGGAGFGREGVVEWGGKGEGLGLSGALWFGLHKVIDDHVRLAATLGQVGCCHAVPTSLGHG